MLQIAIIGLGSFGIRMLEELNEIDCEVIILDKDSTIIDKYKDFARDAFVTDAINKIALEKCIPADIDAAIVDVGDNLEAAIMTTNYLHKMGVGNIITKAHQNEHGDVLKLVGATSVIYPDLDAAQKLTPMLASKQLFNYIQISNTISMAEVGVIQELEGKTILEANVRKNYNLNIIALKKCDKTDFEFISSTDYKLINENILLVAGTEQAIYDYLDMAKTQIKTTKKSSFKNLFLRK